MGKIKDTIWDIESHTEAKHAILKKYLDAWLPILAKRHGRVVFIDGFAGPGEYKGGQDGSPIIAINSVLNHKIKIESEVCFLFIEKDKDRCNFLSEKLNEMELPSNIKYECKCNSFITIVSEMLDELDKKNSKLAPAFVFIDPFGFKDIPFEIIKRLMACKKCEVLINFMFEEINRFIDLPQFEGLYTSLFGTDEWKKARCKKDPKERLEILHNLYEKQLKGIANFVRSFKMKNKYNKTDYFLFFATNHILGLKRMKESMWRVDPKGSFKFSDATYDPNQTFLFEPKPNFNLLKKLILEKYKGKEVGVDELEDFIVIETHFRETHYKTPILRPMEKEGEIEIISNGKRKKGTYPSGTIIKFL